MHIKISIADDHPMVVNGIRNMLHYNRHIEVLHTYHTGKDLMDGLAQTTPDVLLLDIQLPDHSGNELARIISKKYPHVRMLVITSMEQTFHVKDMMRSGCSGYLLKTVSKEVLIEAIEEVYAGREYIAPELKEQLVNEALKIKPPSVSITRREKEILGLIATGLTSQQIAVQLCLSQRTIENHRFSLMQKLQVKNSLGLAKIAMQMGLPDQ